MKVKKEDLETLTKDATKIGILSMALLLTTKCPVPEFYKVTESLLKGSGALRKALELEALIPEEMEKTLFSGEISGTIEELEAAGAFEKILGKKTAKEAIGFKVPGSESDPNKMN